MIEYGNYYNKEDIGGNPLHPDNYLGRAVFAAKNGNASDGTVRCVRKAVQTLFGEALERDEATFGTTMLGRYAILYAVFDYNGVIYYWWEKYLSDTDLQNKGYSKAVLAYNIEHGVNNAYAEAWMASEFIDSNCIYTLEFNCRTRPGTYVGYSSNSTQSPLICVCEHFKNIKIR